MLAGFFCRCSNPGLCLCKNWAETPLRCQCKDRWCHLTHKNPDPYPFRAELWAVFGIWRWFHKARWWEQVQWCIWLLLKRSNCQMCLKLFLVSTKQAFSNSTPSLPDVFNQLCAAPEALVQESVRLNYWTSYEPFHQQSEDKNIPADPSVFATAKGRKQMREPETRVRRGEASFQTWWNIYGFNA